MARVFQAPQEQQLFKEAVSIKPIAENEQQVDDAFRSTLNKKLTDDYTRINNQYEQRQINDQEFASGVESLVNSIPDLITKKQWEPAIGEAKYLSFSNVQSLDDSSIQNGLNDGSISPQAAIDRYNKLATAALQFNTNASVKDAAAWSLKASAIQAAISRKSGSGGRGKEPKNYDDVKRQYEAAKFELDQDKITLENNFSTFDSLLANGDITQDEYKAAKQASIDEYYSSVSKFGFDQDVLNYISDVDPNSGYTYLNDQVNYTRSLGAPTPGYYSGYQTGLDALQQPVEQQKTVSPEEVSNVLQGLTNESSYGPRIQSKPSPAPAGPPPPENISVPLVAPQTNYQANPLGL